MLLAYISIIAAGVAIIRGVRDALTRLCDDTAYAFLALFHPSPDDGNVVEGKALAEALDKVEERLTHLEVTVARGFHDAEQRDLALARKIDIQTEAIRADVRAAIDALTAAAEESRRTAESLRKEHAADRAVLTLTLQQHSRRIHDLENP